MRRPGELHCPNGCDGGRFEALNAPLIVDRQGRYVTHQDRAATYVCAVCQCVAIDIAAAAREMARSGIAPTTGLTCPSCNASMLPPEDDPLADLVECPFCDTRFSIEEGMPRLHGGEIGAGGDTEPNGSAAS